jgi:hypothetical protein
MILFFVLRLFVVADGSLQISLQMLWYLYKKMVYHIGIRGLKFTHGVNNVPFSMEDSICNF